VLTLVYQVPIPEKLVGGSVGQYLEVEMVSVWARSGDAPNPRRERMSVRTKNVMNLWGQKTFEAKASRRMTFFFAIDPPTFLWLRGSISAKTTRLRKRAFF
jgi:hypothetical protein